MGLVGTGETKIETTATRDCRGTVRGNQLVNDQVAMRIRTKFQLVFQRLDKRVYAPRIRELNT